MRVSTQTTAMRSLAIAQNTTRALHSTRQSLAAHKRRDAAQTMLPRTQTTIRYPVPWACANPPGRWL